jgi:DNA-binding PadR family transcriptional regulator
MGRDGRSLGEFEMLVLMGVLRAGREAYGVSVRRDIEERTGRPVARGAVYVTLERLESKGLLESELGGASAVRGGRRKRLYRLRPEGRRSLRSALADLRRMGEGLEPALEEA